MDYNDNDCEGHNLPLTGEENSKISSVLRPFALPKFDFDDSLHGHLRFDSLVENEVFLGIPNQEDNQWIEEFSRGGNGIEFSSSVAESCALPRHVNVWSEATSSESVEMLLKAVGQEEIVHGENMIGESDIVNQLGSSTSESEHNLRQDNKIDDVDLGNPSLTPVVEGKFTRPIQSAGAKGIHNGEYTLQSQDTRFSSYGHVGRDETTEYSNNDLKTLSDKKGETCGLVDESLSNQVQGNIPLGRDIDHTGSHSLNYAFSVGESVDQDKLGDLSVMSSSCVAHATSNSIEEQEERDKNEGRLSRNAVETDNTERHFLHEIPSQMETSKEEHGVEIHTNKFGETSDIPGNRNFESSNGGCNEGTSVDESANDSKNGTVAFYSGTDFQHLSEGEGITGLGMHCSHGVTPVIDENSKLKSLPMILSSHQHKSPVTSEDICPGTNSSLEAPHTIYESNMMDEAQGNPSGDGENNIYLADGPGNLKSSTISEEYCEDKSMTDDTRDAGDAALTQEDIIKDGNHDLPSVISGSMHTCTGDITAMQVDAHASVLGVSTIENEEKPLPLDSSDMVSRDNESNFSNIVNIEKTTGSQFSNSAGGDRVLNIEGDETKLNSSCIEHNQLVECCKGSSNSGDAGCSDQNIETESKAPEQPSTSISLESNHVPAIEVEKCLGSVIEEIKINDQSKSSVKTSRADLPDEACVRVGEVIEVSAKDLIMQGDVALVANVEQPMEAEKEKNDELKSSTVPVTCCTVEIDKSNQATEPGTSLSDPAQSDIHKQASLGSCIKDSGGVLTTSEVSGLNVVSEGEGTFSFDIGPLGGQSSGDSDKCVESFPRIQACHLSLTAEVSPSASGTNQSDAKIVKETSCISSVTAAVCSPSVGMTEHKPRRSSNKSRKGSSRRGNQLKETTPSKQIEKGRKSSQFLSPLGANQLMTYESALKPRPAVSIPTCSLPDLNTSLPSAFFQQPFMDLQQVQLRAQIFVYGSLIQGAAPDEACMVSAFGVSDGGRSAWESSWRTCVERLQSQKAQGNNSGTPLSSRPGPKAPDQSNRHGLHSSDVISSMTGQATNKATPSPVNPMMHLSSPLWSIAPGSEALPPSSMAKSTVFDYQAVSPLNPYQTPPVRNYITQSNVASQVPFQVPRFSSSQSCPFDISTNNLTYPTIETLKLTPAKESSLPIPSGMKKISPIPTTPSGTSTVIAGISLLDSKKVKVSSGQTADTKTRKRKKSTGGEDAAQISPAASLTDIVSTPAVTDLLLKKVPVLDGLNQISLIAQKQAGSNPAPVSTSHYSTPAAVATPSSFALKSTTNQFYSALHPSVRADQIRRSDFTDKSAIEEAKLQAEEAEAHAAAAISQCEDLWSQLDGQATSGLTSDTESKLACAAVSIAAAASVAKAAAAAAKIASSAAIQAKQIADEAMVGTIDITEHGVNFASSSPISILKVGNQNYAPSLAISLAKEAPRKRIEAASRHAENLNATLKAAELAVEAVSHAGKIVSMGDPFSLSQLAMAGPNNYWKSSQMANMSGSKPDEVNRNKSINGNAGQMPNVYTNQTEGPDANMCVTSTVVSPIQRETSRKLAEDREENNFKPQQDKNVSDLAKTTCGVPDPDVGLRSNSFAFSSIREGSYVEVFKDCGDQRKGWYTATVLSLKDVKALVCYTDLKSDEGSEQLKEWISVGTKDVCVPKIRIPHPITAVHVEGTRKRRRAAVTDYTWSVGDKVDAWVQDCWCEGIIAEKNKKDATTLSVHLPAQGETLMVKVWHLRPTLIWSDGQWTEWHGPGQDGTSQGDTPVEKRTKLRSNSIETRGQGELTKNLIFGVAARNEDTRPPLSANEKVFSIGSTREENKPNVIRRTRSGSEKEGSRVIFGVPKPGKKRKFMEVSKHYVSDRSSKASVPNDSVKLAKLFHSQALGSRGSRNNSKHDAKEKQVADSKPRAPKSGKPPSIPRRAVNKKEDANSSLHGIHDTTTSDQTLKGSMSNDENESGEQNLTEFGCSSNFEESSGGSMTFSSQALPQESHKKTRNNIKSERANQGKLALGSEKLAKSEADDKLISEVAEPRRSNRRIQPTSRLLEGLQTSPVIPKVLSLDKGHRSQNKGIAKGNKARG